MIALLEICADLQHGRDLIRGHCSPGLETCLRNPIYLLQGQEQIFGCYVVKPSVDELVVRRALDADFV